MPEVVEKGRELFVRRIIRAPVYEHISAAVLSLLHTERDGFAIDRSAVTGCVDVLLQLSDNLDGLTVYKRALEPSILRESEAFYVVEGEKLLRSCDAPEYLRKV